MVSALRLLKISLFIGFLKILKANNKVHSDDDVLEEEMVKYVRLNEKKIEHIMINSFKNRSTDLREILGYKNKIQETRGLNLKNQEQTKKELNALKTEKDEELELLQEDLKFLRLKSRFRGRSNRVIEEIELEEKTEKRIDEIDK